MSNAEKLSLTVVNNSDISTPTFALFVKIPYRGDQDSFTIAWVAQQIDNEGNSHVFEWRRVWGFCWTSHGVAAGVRWTGRGSLDADPGSNDKCAARLIYNGDYSLEYATGTADGHTLTIIDDSTLPPFSAVPSAVGVTLDGKPTCAVNAGPNLQHEFDLHPTYYIAAESHVQGQMVDVTTLTELQEISFTDGDNALTAILDANNEWTVTSTRTVDPSTALTSGNAAGVR